jgi:hypothetical protein
MVSQHVYYQLILFALLWLVIILHLIRPKRPVMAPATPTEEPEPLTSKRHRSTAPTPIEGLTYKPPWGIRLVRAETIVNVLHAKYGFLASFGDMTLWNILASCAVILYTSPYPYVTNVRL